MLSSIQTQPASLTPIQSLRFFWKCATVDSNCRQPKRALVLLRQVRDAIGVTGIAVKANDTAGINEARKMLEDLRGKIRCEINFTVWPYHKVPDAVFDARDIVVAALGTISHLGK